MSDPNIIPLGSAAAKIVGRFAVHEGGKGLMKDLRDSLALITRKEELEIADGLLVRAMAKYTRVFGSTKEALARAEGILSQIRESHQRESKP